MKKKTKKKNSKFNSEFQKFKKKWKSGSIGEKILTIIMAGIVLVFISFIAFLIYIVIAAPDFEAEKLYTYKDLFE